MADTLQAVKDDALVLPPDQRLELARQLLESVEPDLEEGVEEAWVKEIAKRVGRLKSGEVSLVSAGEVFARLRAIAPAP